MQPPSPTPSSSSDSRSGWHVVGRFPRFAQAQAALEELFAKGMARHLVSVGAEGLRLESGAANGQGRWWDPLVHGFAAGAAFGATLTIPILLILGQPESWAVAVLAGSLFGGLLGVGSRLPVAARLHAMEGKLASSICAANYVVTCSAEHAEHARTLLGRSDSGIL